MSLPVLSKIPNDTLCRFAQKWIPEILEGTFPVFWAQDLISSQMDADRMDYLLRDAYMCGVSYVSFDRKWLLNNIELKEIPHEDKRLGLVINAEKGLHALESFIISRYHMYEQVYLHKTTRGMEQLVIKIFQRAKFIQEEGIDLHILDSSLTRVFAHDFSINDYLMLDDFLIICQIKVWQDHPDPILNELSRCFIGRKPFKMFKEVKDQALLPAQVYRNLDSIMGGEEGADYFFFEDDYINNPYKDEYLLGTGKALEAGHIWISRGDGQIRELAEESFLIHAMRNKSTRKTRGYVHRKYL